MAYGAGTYGSAKGRPSEDKKKKMRKKMAKKPMKKKGKKA